MDKEKDKKKPSQFRHLFILFKKSLLIQSRHKLGFFFELFFPGTKSFPVVFLIDIKLCFITSQIDHPSLVLFGSLFIIGRYFGDVEQIETITAWDTYNPRELSPRNRINLCRYDETTNQTIPQMDIAYAPESNAAKAIMDRVIDEISYSVS